MRIRLILMVILTAVIGIAKAEYFRILDYGVDIKIYGKEAYFDVVETITVEFTEPRRGIIRTIPIKYSKDGKEGEIVISSVDVENYNFATSKGSSNLTIKIGSADKFVSGTQVYKISYRVKKAWLFMENHTEFYWNLTGNEWNVDIDSAHWSVTLDEALTMSDHDYVFYTGGLGEKDTNALMSYYMGKFSGNTTKVLSPRQGVTMAINLPMTYVSRPTKFEIWWEKFGMMSIAGLLLAVIFGLFYRVWSKYGRDYPIVKMVQFAPPKNITPAEAGLIIDEKADNIDLISLIPYWASNGHMTIQRIQVSKGNDDHQLTKLKDLPDNAETFEKIIFNRLFTNGNTVMISSLQNEFADTMSAARRSLQSHLTNIDIYYPISMKAQTMTYISSFVLLALAVIGGFVLQSFWIAAGLGIAALIGLFFAYHMLKKNEKGVHLYQHILGFKMFVKAAEKDKIERMLKEDPMYFEKTLPYAMIFGYATQWSEKFDGLLLEPPQWYVGPHIYHGGYFNAGDFGRSMEESVHEMESVFNSVPEPKGNFGDGGGFSGGGGGFSGGGFGGGGGSSW